MQVSVEPLSAVRPQLLKDHLLRHGIPSDIIEWKYFDRSLSPGRERGFVWLKNDRVQGMIGLVPFRLAGPPGRVDCAWTCDWFVESSPQNPGVGVLVLRGAIEAAGLLMTVGGNEVTHKIVPRLAACTVPEAAVELIVALKVGGTRIYKGIEARVSIGPFSQLAGLPLRREPRSTTTVRTEAGVAPALQGLLASLEQQDGWAPRYDSAYLDWQLGRCPVLECASTYTVAPESGAGAVFWRLKSDVRHWRIALWMRARDEQNAGAVLDEAVAQVMRRGGQSMSTVVSRTDTSSMGLFTGAGFRTLGRTFPLYVLSRTGLPSVSIMHGMSYLDSDMAYRF